MPARSLRRVGTAVATAILLAGCGAAPTASGPPRAGHPRASLQRQAPRPAPPATAAATTTPTTTLDPAQEVTVPELAPGSTEVAVLTAAAPGSATPGGPATGTVPATWYTAVSSLPVIAQAPGWLEVRLAQRPNESTAWIPATDARLVVTPDRIVVDLTTRHLELFVHDQLVDDFPAGVGVPSTPTPTGDYFVAFFAAAPSPGYGPFVLVTSAHSDAITDWDDSGDAIIAIHGPIDATADTEIGTTGAAVSNGCVRLHDSDLAQLRDVPAGTPVDIVS